MPAPRMMLSDKVFSVFQNLLDAEVVHVVGMQGLLVPVDGFSTASCKPQRASQSSMT